VIPRRIKAHFAKAGQAKQTGEVAVEEEGTSTRAVRECENCGKEAAKMKKCSVCRLVRYC